MDAALIDVQLAEFFESVYVVVCIVTVGSFAGLGVLWWKKSQ